ncbi:hypothetical protein Q4I30_005818 [Leishmania utingensis]|uniref:RanBP2-type domain-containing protein n=1 Tax=Leishmania utingensis TaxID=653362 RepID=A0AAW3A4K4_9TRYP
MNYLRTIVSDVKLKYRASLVVDECVLGREKPEFPKFLTECVTIADGHPELILSTIRLYLIYSQPESAYGGLLLLEQLVSLCNYAFHLALARDCDIQDLIIHLAVRRGEGEAHRKAQRLARLTLLEYSRVFVDDRDLMRLSSLISSFEHRTHRSLMRCLNVQNRRVHFREVGVNDIVLISPEECLGCPSSSAGRPVKPLQLSSAPEVWPCHVCTYLNAPSATCCAACETLRTTDTSEHHSSPDMPSKTSPAFSTPAPTATATSPGSPSPVVPPLPIAERSAMERGDSQASSHASVEDMAETFPINNLVSTSEVQLYPSHGSPTVVCVAPVHLSHSATSTAVPAYMSDASEPISPSTDSELRDGADEGDCNSIGGSTAHTVASHVQEKGGCRSEFEYEINKEPSDATRQTVCATEATLCSTAAALPLITRPNSS